ncbi:glycosyltransferase family 2 protein [Conexibacter woesei]|uniref:Glycosyl transferase family 2 n=1 Tax=Conexibacter woesei (strain DSM 14684 / CCUG 47730 / CIP 108061 / JCM 11494 / NBRC 100937 / ID131577) TaxID=469383 RepID=D3FFC0_CONWI|nr:glycosyltransferase [Conexibacter woesei]ADB53713.1 glycosyl transferase family 2 [Conexibacter woesei DSM 14684]
MTSASAGAPAVAIVVVTHNSSHAIDGWLAAAEALAATCPLELCVVDSGSDPDELAHLREHVEGRVASLVALPNVGFGRACNAGAEATSAAAIIFTNPDTRIVSLPAAVSRGEGVDGVMGGFSVEADGSRVPLGFAHLPTLRWEIRNMLFGRHVEVFHRTADAPAWVLGGALAIDRGDFDRAGGFLRRLFLFFEDADLCAVHAELGGRVHVDPAFVVEHDGSASSRPRRDVDLDGVARESGRIFVARHGSRWHAAVLYLLLLVWYVPRRVALELLRRVRGRRSTDSLRVVVLCLLFPSIVKRRLGVPRADRDPR